MNLTDRQVLSEKIRTLYCRDIAPEESSSFLIEVLETYFECWLGQLSRECRQRWVRWFEPG